MKKFDWMHPSYRDLVIEELIEDQELRLRFLSAVGLEGLKLALSDRGGTSEVRLQPLINNETSKSIIKSRILEIANKSFDYQDKHLLEILVNAFQPSNKNSEWLYATLRDVIRVLYNKWNGQEIWISSLEAYCEASVLLYPLPPMPDLEPTWKAVIFKVQEAIAEDSLLEPYPIQTWVDFINLIKQNEPRFLRQVGFPSRNLELVHKFLDQLELELDTELLAPTKDEIRSEAERIYNLADCAIALSSLVEELRIQFQKVSRLLRNEKYEELMEKLEPEEEEDREDDSTSLRADRDFDIDALFTDL